MQELRRRIRALLERVLSGEGAQVAADVGETLELWLSSGLLPLPGPVNAKLERIGKLVGELARASRPAPVDVPPPPSEDDRREPEPDTGFGGEMPSLDLLSLDDVLPLDAPSSAGLSVGEEKPGRGAEPSPAELSREASSRGPERTERGPEPSRGGAAKKPEREPKRGGSKKRGPKKGGAKSKKAEPAPKPKAGKSPEAASALGKRVAAKRGSDAPKPKLPTPAAEPSSKKKKKKKKKPGANGAPRPKRPTARRGGSDDDE